MRSGPRASAPASPGSPSEELVAPHKIVEGAYAALDRAALHPQEFTDEVSARAPTPEGAALLRLGSDISS